MYEAPYENMVIGEYTLATLPAPMPEMAGRYAYVLDRPGGVGFMECLNGTSWVPSRKQVSWYAGATDVSGNFTLTYTTAYPATPSIAPALTPPVDTETNWRITNESASGFTVQAFRRAVLTVLGINLLSFGTTPAAGVNVRVLVVER